MHVERPQISRELNRALGAATPHILALRGLSGSGRRELLRAALSELGDHAAEPIGPTLWFEALPQPDSLRRRNLRALLADQGIAPPPSEGRDAHDALLMPLAEHAEQTRRRVTLVIGAAQRVVGEEGGWSRALVGLWSRARARALPLSIILLLDPDSVLPTGADGRAMEAHTVHVSDLDPLEIRALLPRWPALERFLLRATLGTRSGRLAHLDRRAGLATNLQHLVLQPGGPLAHEILGQLKSALHRQERYVGVLDALAHGQVDWGTIRAHVPELAPGSTLGPYMKTLEAQGWVVVEHSLDARPGSRRRRYRLIDPFVGFWMRSISARLGALRLQSPTQFWGSHGAAALDAAARHTLAPAIHERLMLEPAPLGVPARETGALWGEGYDLPIAGTLVNGGAFYGDVIWGRPAQVADLERLEAQLRLTRYGFGRETRLRVLFVDRPAPEALVRRAARSEQVALIEIDDLF